MINRILCRSLNLSSFGPIKTMDKQKAIARQLMKKRLADKEKSVALNNADIQIIGSDGQGFNPCLLVNSEGHSYLFNCCEGTQRLCYSNKIRLLNVQNVFLTRSHNWSRVSGIYGMSLTLQDIGSSSLTVHSPQNLSDLFESTSSFISYGTTGMLCSSVDTRLDRKFQDKGLSVETILIRPKKETMGSNSSQMTQTKRFKSEESYLIAYLCKLPDIAGALDPEKCRLLNVPIGPMLALLKSGKNVTLADGTIVKSHEVCQPKTIGTSFLIVDCDHESLMDDIINSQSLATLQKNRASSNQQQIDLVIHFSTESVVKSCIYQAWMKKFAPDCKHIILSNFDSKAINLDHSYRHHYLLQQIDKELFKDLYIPENRREIYESSKSVDLLDNLTGDNKEVTSNPDYDEFSENEIVTKKENLENVDQFYMVEHLDKISLKPHKQLESVDVFDKLDTVYLSLIDNIEFKKELNKLRDIQKTLPSPKDHEPEVVFLGTGSAMPQKYRNTSCILLNFNDKRISIIFDCGEDSYGQLFRYYGPELLESFLKQLKLIYISHHHADHHIGLIKLLLERKRLINEPLTLIAPSSIEILLNFYNSTFQDISDTYDYYHINTIRTKPTSKSDPEQMISVDATKNKIYKHFDGFLKELTIVPVVHCPQSCAVVMKFNIGQPNMDSFTLGYSGDARPSEDFVLAGQGCDLLIHEATMDFRSQEEAKAKKHSTSTEAIEVGRNMNAKFTLLTHFTQRLSKIPYFNDDFDDKVGFAFDNMSIKCPTQLSRMPILKPVLEAAFQKELNDMEVKYRKMDAKKKILEETDKNQ